MLLALAVASGCSLIAGSDEDSLPAPRTPPAEIALPPDAPSSVTGTQLDSAAGPRAGRRATRIEQVTIESTPPTTRVVIALDGFAEPEVSLLVNQRLVVDVPGTTCESLPRVVESGGDPLVERVRTGQHASPDVKSRVVIDLLERADFTVRSQDDRIVVLLAPASPDGAAAAVESGNVILGAEPSGGRRASALPPQSAALPVAAVAPEPLPAQPPSPEPVVELVPEESAALPAEAAPVAVPARIDTPAAATTAPPREPTALPLATPPGDGEPATPMVEATRTGKRISIDFTETDVRTVLDLIASAGGYRVIFSPEVAGTVSITLIDRPWEDALATVLRAKLLREVRHEDVMLVSPVPRGQSGARRSSP